MRDQLIEQGYCVIPDALDLETLARIRSLCEGILSRLPQEHRERNRSQGSLVLIADYPEFAALIAHPGLAAGFRTLEFEDPRFSSGYIISKPPKSPALFWHQDWWGWDDSVSYTNFIAQVFFMIYLSDTSVENGCLRVIPGSHRSPHPIHHAKAAHDESLSRVEEPSNFLYHSQPGEVEVPVNAGDLVVGDARLLHGSHPNASDQERTLITLWFHPDYQHLPAGMQARIMEIFHRRGVDTDRGSDAVMTPLTWPDHPRKRIAPYLPTYAGEVPPHAWNRIPRWTEQA